MKHLDEDKKQAMKSWLREPAVEAFAEVIKRGHIDPLRPRITAGIDNHGGLAYLIGRLDGLEQVLNEMRRIAQT